MDIFRTLDPNTIDSQPQQTDDKPVLEIHVKVIPDDSPEPEALASQIEKQIHTLTQAQAANKQDQIDEIYAMIQAINTQQKQVDEILDLQARELAKNRVENQSFKQETERVKEDLLKIVEKLSRPKTPPPGGKIPKSVGPAQVYGPRPKSQKLAPLGNRRASSVTKPSSDLSECSNISSGPSDAAKSKQLKRCGSAPRPRNDASPPPKHRGDKSPGKQRRDVSPPHFRPEIVPQFPLPPNIPEKIGGFSIASCCQDKVKSGSFHCRRLFADIKSDRMQAFRCCGKIYCCSACHRWEEGCDERSCGVVCNWCFKAVVSETYCRDCRRMIR